MVVIDNTGYVFMYKCNIEVHSCNNCCHAKALSVNYSECVCSVSYPAFSEHALYYIVICSLSGCTKFVHFISHNSMIFGNKFLNPMCVF